MNINIYNPYVRRELELYHHGIEGQKWGKRNGPPYPLSKEDYSAAEKKAVGYRKQLNRLAMRRNESSESMLKNAYNADKVAKKHNEEVLRKGNNSKKATELNEKYKHYMNNIELSKDEINKIDIEIKRISDQLIDEGFDLARINYNRDVAVGENIAAYILSGGILGRGMNVEYPSLVFGVKFDPEKIAKIQQERNGNNKK